MRIAVLALPFLLAACSTSPISADQARPATQVIAPELLSPSPGTGTVAVLRDRGLFGTACLHQVKVNGRHVATLDNGEGVTLHLPAGNHLLNVESGRGICPNVMMTAEPVVVEGGRITYRISLSSDGALRLNRTE